MELPKELRIEYRYTDMPMIITETIRTEELRGILEQLKNKEIRELKVKEFNEHPETWREYRKKHLKNK